MAHQSCFCKSTTPTLRKWPSQHWRRSASRANKSAVSIWKVRAVQHQSASRALKMSQTRFQVYRFGDFICFIVECAYFQYFDVLLFLLLGCSCFFTVTIVCTCILILMLTVTARSHLPNWPYAEADPVCLLVPLSRPYMPD